MKMQYVFEKVKRSFPLIGQINRIYHLQLSIYYQVQETLFFMATINDRLSAIETRLQKASGEITSLIASLRDALNNGGPTEEIVSRLETAAQQLDDIVPDAPPVDTEEPAPTDETETDEEENG